MFAAGGVAVAAGRAGVALPGEDARERLAEQRLFVIDGGHQRAGVDLILAHGGVAGFAGDGCAMLLANLISVLRRAEDHIVLESQWAAHVRAGGAIRSE